MRAGFQASSKSYDRSEHFGGGEFWPPPALLTTALFMSENTENVGQPLSGNIIIQYFVSLLYIHGILQYYYVLGSLLYAKPMRAKKYLTVLDPLQEKFGDFMTGLLLLGELFAELMWGASILIALGKHW